MNPVPGSSEPFGPSLPPAPGGGDGKSGSGGNEPKANNRGQGAPEDDSAVWEAWDQERADRDAAHQREQRDIERRRRAAQRRALENPGSGCQMGQPLCDSENGQSVGVGIVERSAGGQPTMKASTALVVAFEGAPVITAAAAAGGHAFSAVKSMYYYAFWTAGPGAAVTRGGSVGAMRLISYGRNAAVKLRKHPQHMRETARRLGISIPTKPSKPATRKAMENFITRVVIDGKTTYGRYMTYAEAQWSRLGDAIVVRQMDGTFITFLDATKGGQAANIPGGL